MLIPDFLKGGAIIGVVIGFWDKIKDILWRITAILVQRVEISTEDAHDAIIAYLVTHYKKLNTYDKVYGASNETYRNGKFGLVAFEKFGQNTIFFLSKKRYLGFVRIPFLFSQPKEKPQTDTTQSGINSTKIFSVITCLRGTIDIDAIVKEAAQKRNNISWQIEEAEESANRFDIFYLPSRENDNHAYLYKNNVGYSWYRQNQYRLLGVSADEIGRELTTQGSALDNLYFPDEVKKLIEVIALWVKSKDWYKEKNIPWKRGWLLYGPPGTGKTALARAFAEDLNMPVYVYQLSQMSNQDMLTAWRNMQLNVPCIALIEDIDNVFHGRKNIMQNTAMMSHLFDGDEKDNGQENGGGSGRFSPLTFDTLLNCIDGVDKSNGVFTIITTNDITKIDQAIGQPTTLEDGTPTFISSRPGRIDRAIELTYMLTENKIQMAGRILGEFETAMNNVQAHIATNQKETPAQFQEYCSQLAIQEYWKQKEAKPEIHIGKG
ncbi:MAG: ATP-binding protein [Cytophagaceae bacterium]|nr:ATP-binding protein [Cytophagaceae bacterium]MBK9935418.1 ATP-binding protein [Cytophagaceae bacterium]MBL0301860.1 ATP-binding protein [Cytophagaceae bacterium]MBL0324686.1 ATP-binding protein [Cytophagaceae bacterium]